MSHQTVIKSVDHLNEYIVPKSLQKSLQPFQARINAKKFKELFAASLVYKLEGAGISWLNRFHPTAKYIHVIANTNHNRIMEHLLLHVTPQTTVIFSCWEDEVEKIQLLQSFSFQLFRKTYMETYNVEHLLQKLPLTDTTLSLLTLEQVLGHPELEKQLFQLLKHNYEQTHLHNPAAEQDWLTWKENLLDDAPDFQRSYVAVREGQVIAYILLHPINEVHYEIGWVGQQKNVNLLPILTYQLKELDSIGVKTVAFEIDTTDYHAWQFAELLELQHKKSWHSYKLDVKGENR